MKLGNIEKPLGPEPLEEYPILEGKAIVTAYVDYNAVVGDPTELPELISHYLGAFKNTWSDILEHVKIRFEMFSITESERHRYFIALGVRFEPSLPVPEHYWGGPLDEKKIFENEIGERIESAIQTKGGHWSWNTSGLYVDTAWCRG